MVQTSLTYLDTMYELSGSAKLLAVQPNASGVSLILEKTLFYPQGGGQACDTGSIEGRDFRFRVQSVVYSEGIVLHIGTMIDGAPQVGEEVSLHIDEPRRHYNSCLQSGGHILLNAMNNVGQKLVAVKGYHFPDGPYVEFRGESLPEQAREPLVIALQTEIDRLINLDLPITARFVNGAELAHLCKNIPSNVPTDKPTRVVTIDNFSQPCGGTHVKTLGELRGMRVDKIRSKKGDTRISYSLPATAGDSIANPTHA